VFPEIDGYVLSLVRSRPPDRQGTHSPNWRDRHFVLRDARSPQNLFCIGSSYSPTSLRIGGAMYYLINAALRFFGELKVICLPLGSEWELTLSDVYP
jgi:hypothetical protein